MGHLSPVLLLGPAIQWWAETNVKEWNLKDQHVCLKALTSSNNILEEAILPFRMGKRLIKQQNYPRTVSWGEKAWPFREPRSVRLGNSDEVDLPVGPRISPPLKTNKGVAE